MRAPRIIPLVVAIVALLGGAGCGGGHREISDLQRKEAAHLASEADFAITLRDFPRAEGLLARVVELCPDTGPYWVSLGSVQLRLGQRSKAKASYQGALRALENAAKDNPDDPAAWLAQVQVLAVLGQRDEARKLLAQTARKFPSRRSVRQLSAPGAFEQMLADPNFKALAL